MTTLPAAPVAAAGRSSSSVVVARATTAAALTVLMALAVLLLALRWPALQWPGLGVLLGVPLVRNAFLIVGLRGRDRAHAVFGAVLLVMVAVAAAFAAAR
ncbi:MAG: hypothetical protein FJ137_11990 [Deltaproteobacteria bacterium]|nr:hypothetical protein [Deltaproteobacteria bacterium]